MTILITGAAGFIGFHLARRLLGQGHAVVGLDHLNEYYDVRLKKDRLSMIEGHPSFVFHQADVADAKELEQIFANHSVDTVIHLAAQAGVRYSLQNPHAYIHSNIAGFTCLLEACRHRRIKHLIYASSSSVYGDNSKVPFSVHDSADHPVSLYAATKKSNELFAHVYSHLFGIPTTGLRFFTVYGPWGRPDMAYFSFTKNILEGRPVKVFNYGKMRRDFTYIDDIVDGIELVMGKIPKRKEGRDRVGSDPAGSYEPYKIYNMGNSEPVNLLEFIHILEQLLGKKALIEYAPMQDGDMEETFADMEDAQRELGFAPSTPIEKGLQQFVAWYLEYYRKK